jgi:phage shock protein C
MVNRIISWFEKQAFGVCTWWGEKLGIRSNNIRMYFIYLSFFTAGSPVIIYFVMAFMLQHKAYFKFNRAKKSSVWEI